MSSCSLDAKLNCPTSKPRITCCLFSVIAMTMFVIIPVIGLWGFYYADIGDNRGAMSPEKSIKIGDRIVESISFSPDNENLILGCYDGTVLQYNISSNSLVNIGKHNGAVLSIAFSKDGKWMATGGTDNRVLIWDWQSRRLEHTISNSNVVLGIAFCEQGNILGIRISPEAVTYWDVETGRKYMKSESQGIVLLVPCHRFSGRLFTFTSDGSKLAEGYENGVISIVEIQKCTKHLEINAHNDQVNSIVFSPDGSVLASAGGSTQESSTPFFLRKSNVRLWDSDNGTIIARYGRRQLPVNCVTISSDGDWLAAAGRDGVVEIWRVDSTVK